MGFLDKIKKRFTGSNNNNAPKQCKDGHNCECADAEKIIDDTMIDADKRIEQMLKEMRG